MKKTKLMLTLALCVLLVLTSVAAIADELIGSAEGRNGEVPVTVVYEDGKIVSVAVGENVETAGIADNAIRDMPARIVEAQSLMVDAVAGATLTSEAIRSAVETAFVNGGVDVTPFKQKMAAVELADGGVEETDVVIVGAGLSGLMAAYELKENYPDVNFVVLDKLEMVSGSVPTSGGMIVATSSEYHVRDNVTCTTQDIADLFKFTSGVDVRTALVDNIYAKSDVTVERLLGYGLPVDGRTYRSSKYSDSVYALTAEGGGAGFGRFLNEYVGINTFDLRLSTKAEDLIVEDGKVVGVIAADKEKRYELRAPYVLLATGGFGSNPELMEEYLPLFADGFFSTNAGATGDGIMMTRQFGTKILGDGSMGSIVAPDGSALIKSFFMVNLDGERFIGEGDPKYVLQRAVSQQPDHTAFLLADANYADMDTIESKIAKGFVKQYDTLEALAQDNGIDAAKLVETVAAYNAAADAGEEIPAKEFSLNPSSATKIEQAPFYVEKITLRTFGTIPGIEVSDTCQVLTGDGEIVEGLYAAGELIAGNAYTRQYPGAGVGISFAANSGRFVAETIGELLTASK